MKSVLISTRPKWCEKICREIGKDENGKSIYEKEIEVRKSKPSEIPFKGLIYCTKGKPYLYRIGKDFNEQNGKVIGEFICDKVYEIEYRGKEYYCKNESVSVTNQVATQSCLDFNDLFEYLGVDRRGYGWHISDLKIYDKPKKLSEFRKPCPFQSEDCEEYCKYADLRIHTAGNDELVEVVGCNNRVTRPPQSWCYVEELRK